MTKFSYCSLKFLVHKEEEICSKKFVKMLGLKKKSAYVFYECPLSRIPDAPQKRSKGSIMIAVQSKAVEYQDKIREAMDKLLFKGIVTGYCFLNRKKERTFYH